MKKLFCLVAFALTAAFCFATTPVEKEKTSTEKVSKVESSKSHSNQTKDSTNEEFCSVTCSTTINGVTFTASAGNFLSGCQRASRVCHQRLFSQVHQHNWE